MADDIASNIVAINLVLLAHLVYRVAILVVEFSRVFVEDIDAFLIGYIVELALIGYIDRGGVIRVTISTVASCCEAHKEENKHQ